MSKRFSQKVAALGLALTTAAWLGGAVLVAPASAATTSDISAQIQALQAQLQALESQLAAQGGSSSTASTCTFSRSLTVRSTGSDVKCLQQYLNASGDTVAKTGAGSSGNETTYFGPATKAAVAKWQAANGVTPAIGYFGPISRAEYVKLTASTGTTTGTTTGGTGTTTGTTTGNVPASGLAVSLASTSAAAGSAIAGAGQIPVGSFTFTASNAKGETVTGLTFTKVGVVSDSNITNAYLVDSTGSVVAQYQSLSSGVATFTGLSLNVAAGASATYTLKVDLSTSANAGNTIAWQLTSATVSSGDTVTGTPVTAATQTVTTVSNPSLAKATFTFNSVGSSINAGTQGALVADITANVTNNSVYLKGVKFEEVGSATASDIQNLKLYVAGSQVGNAVATAASDGTIYFDLSSANAKLNTGNTDIQLYADIMGSPNRTAQFTILHTYDVSVTDSQYSSGISPSVTTTNATTITINPGTLTVSLDANSPTGNVAEGVSAVTLGKFDVKAAGEAVRINYLDAEIVGTGWTAIASSTADLTNVRIIDDVGGQVGNTISTIATGSTTGDCTYSNPNTSTLVCHFGDSSSNINYTIPANTTRVLSVVADLASTVTATALQASLPTMTSNAIGQISNQTTSSGAATGGSLTVITNSLTSATNNNVGTLTYAVGASNVEVGSFILTASSAQGVNVSSLTLTTTASSTLELQNLKVMVGSTQFGSSQGTVKTSAATDYAFSGSTPINVAAGQSVTVNVKADILSGSTAGTYAGVVTLKSWSATGQTSGSAISIDQTDTGNSVTVNSGGTLTKALAASPVIAQQVAMGSTAVTLASFKVTASNTEAINLTQVVVNATTTATADLSNVKLMNGTTQVGYTQPSVSSTTAALTFTIPTSGTGSLQIPQSGYEQLDVVANIGGVNAATSADTVNVGLGKVTGNGALSNVATSTASTDTDSGATLTLYQGVFSVANAIGSSGVPALGTVNSNGTLIGAVTFTNSSPVSKDLTLGTTTILLTVYNASTSVTTSTISVINASTGQTAGSITATLGTATSTPLTTHAVTVAAGASQTLYIYDATSLTSAQKVTSTNPISANASMTEFYSNDGVTGSIVHNPLIATLPAWSNITLVP